MRRELAAIALLLLAVFLGGVLAAQGLAELRTGGGVGANFGFLGELLVVPMLAVLGWTGAVWIPLLPAVHALRLFGRMEERTDRSWLVFLAGLALLAPIATGLALHLGAEESRAAGLWGAGTAFYMQRAFGSIGAWIVFACLLSALTAATLAWNPIRVLLYKEGPAVAASAETAEPQKRRRNRGQGRAGEEPLATALEPTPEEMPAVDPTLMTGDDIAEPEADGKPRRARKKTKAEASAERDEEIAAAIDAMPDPGPGADEL
ncbi:MAG TPA: hypothetical protein VHM67_16680, partial [Gemmatimonadaceae bacterium]|nr:hypothetical protein [Gemmatimonadaceae bacterium]